MIKYFTIWVYDFSFYYLTYFSATVGSFSQSFTAGKFYYLKIQWSHFTSTAYLRLRWSYPGQATDDIPSSMYYYPEYVASSPYQVPSYCAVGFHSSNSSHPNTCVEICGDGIRVGDEK